MVFKVVLLALALVLPTATGQALSSSEDEIYRIPAFAGHELHEANLEGGVESYQRDFSTGGKTYSSPMKEMWKAVLGFVAGLLIVALTPVALWHNEQQHVKMFQLFGRAKTICVAAMPERDAKYDDALIHVNATTETPEILELKVLPEPVKVEKALKLRAKVLMYAWTETKEERSEDTADGGKREWTEYSYSKEWVENPAETYNFGDQSKFKGAGGVPNPKLNYKSNALVVKEAYLGTKKGYRLNPELIEKLGNWTGLSAAELEKVAKLIVKRDAGSVTLSAAAPSNKYVVKDVETAPAAAVSAADPLKKDVEKAPAAAVSAADPLKKDVEKAPAAPVNKQPDALHKMACCGCKTGGEKKEEQKPEAPKTGDAQVVRPEAANEKPVEDAKLKAPELGKEETKKAEPVKPADPCVVLEGSTITTVAGGVAEVGDLKIEFEKVPTGEATLLAVQLAGNKLGKMLHSQEWVFQQGVWKLKPKEVKADATPEEQAQLLDSAIEEGSLCTACDAVAKLVESGTEIYYLDHGKKDKEEVLKVLETEQNTRHCLIQLVGFVLLVVGFSMIFGIVPAVFRFIPLIGTTLQAIGMFFVVILAFLLSTVVWTTTVGLSWAVARPAKGIPLLILAIVAVALPFVVAKALNPGDATTTPSP